MKEEIIKLHEEIEQLRKEIAEFWAGQTPQPIWLWYPPLYPYPYVYPTYKISVGTGTGDYCSLNNSPSVSGKTIF